MLNDVLHGMSDNDLRQRYKATYIRYNGQVIYVRDFVDSTLYYKTAEDGEATCKFDWKLVDTSRPRGMWYAPCSYKYAVYLSYPPKKQYHRGLCQENVVLGFLNAPIGGFKLYTHILEHGADPIQNKPLVLKEGGFFKDHLYLTAPYEDVIKILFRQQQIGTINLDKQELSLYYPRFMQEVFEANADLERYKFVSLWGTKRAAPLRKAYRPGPFDMRPLEDILRRDDDEPLRIIAEERRNFEEGLDLALNALDRWQQCLEQRE